MRRPKACPYRRGDGTYWARIRYTGEDGKIHEKSVRVANQAEASAKSDELVKQFEAQHGLSTDKPTPITFNKFADLYIPHIEGQRSYKTKFGFLKTLRAHFGNKKLALITYKDIQGYYRQRLKSVSDRTGNKLKRASVNREVALVSKMFNEATEQGFVAKNPYKDGPPLIKPQQETRRNRVLSEEEEKRLLAVCTGRRAHLRPIIVAALDTGATKSQLLRLTWGDIRIGLRTIGFRLSKGIVNVRMGEDLASELAILYRGLEDEYYTYIRSVRSEDAPFMDEWLKPKPVFRDFKTSFTSACRAAKINDLRFHDLRYTVKTRSEAKIKRFKELLTRPTQ